ncbi:MAG: protein kinase [Planctomycetia bacterium]|nr:protein kinase [Planctomycetia bacterium]
MPEPSRPSPKTDGTATESQGPPDQTVPRAETVSGAPPSSGALAAPNFSPPQFAGELGTFGRYRVLKELGRGGMGAVYLGYDASLERKVALKVMLPDHAANPDARERFLREARSAAKIKSDHVVTIFDVGEEYGIPFIAMEYLLGYPLDKYLKEKGELPLPHILRIGRETALGLAAAHELGLVHRDIKPGNLWLEAPKGRVKLLDFGLARPMKDDIHLTGTGAVLGTPAYMSPEQGRGLKVDHRCDLFSLGVMLYRLSTGKLPFTGDSMMAVLTSLAVDTPTPVRQLKPDVPEALEAVINRLLEKNPADRFQTAKEVVDAIRAIEHPKPVPGVLPVVVPLPVQSLVVGAQTQNVWEGIDDSQSVPVPLATGSETELQSSPAPNPQRTKPDRKLSKLPAILACAVLVVAVVLLAVMMSWPKKEPVAQTNGKENPPPPPVGKQPPEAKDIEREVTTELLARGGMTNAYLIFPDQKEIRVTQASQIPAGAFVIDAINVHTPFTDADLKRLEPLRRLRVINLLGGHSISTEGLRSVLEHKSTLGWLRLDVGPTTDEDLKLVAQLSELDLLGLNKTQVTDDGLKHLVTLKKLRRLELAYTSVTDTAIETLVGLNSLTELNVKNTKLTEPGLKKLAEKLPGCKIIHDGGTIEPTVVADPDRKAAEYVLFIGGIVRVNGEAKDIKAAADLPKERFALVHINLGRNKKLTREGFANFSGCKHVTSLNLEAVDVSDAALAHFKDCGNLTTLSLAETKVGNDGLAHLKGCNQLTQLYLNDTQITDAGVAHFKNCKNLAVVRLDGTQIGNAALDQFKECKRLVSLEVRRTKVTAEKVVELRQALPKCDIQGDGIIEPKK